jgi:hypothetical protein
VSFLEARRPGVLKSFPRVRLRKSPGFWGRAVFRAAQTDGELSTRRFSQGRRRTRCRWVGVSVKAKERVSNEMRVELRKKAPPKEQVLPAVRRSLSRPTCRQRIARAEEKDTPATAWMEIRSVTTIARTLDRSVQS